MTLKSWSLKEVDWSEAIKTKYPEPVVFVVSSDKKGKPNVMPAGWSMITSGNPPMLAVSIGHTRYTHGLISETGEFAIAFPNQKMGEEIEYTGSCSGRDLDKFAECNLKPLPSKHMKPPLIKDAVACFECKTRGKLSTGDHTIFAGEVLAAYVSEKYTKRIYNFGDGKFKKIL